MALVGEMQYLTIGDSTYSLPSSGGSGTVTSVGVSNATNGGLTISDSPITSSGSIIIGHSNVLTSAQTTSGVYPIKIDKNGHISDYGSAVTIPSITLNGSSSTSPSFYAPTSAGTSGYVLKSNGSGAPTWTSAVLTDENVKSTAVTGATTNYIVGSTTSTTTTGGLSKHASAVICTTVDASAGGYAQLRLGNTTATSSAGGKEGQIRLYGTNATYYLELKAGAISSSNKTITFPNATGTVALTSDIPTDENVTSTTIDNGTYYIVGSSSSSTNTGGLSKHADIVAFIVNGLGGSARIELGNAGVSTSSNGKYGTLRLYGNNSYYTDIKAGTVSDSNKTITFPNATGTVALTSDLPSVPTITLNGSSTTSPSFYAPTSAGTSGYVLTSNGSGAPSWTSAVLTDEKVKTSTTVITNHDYGVVFGDCSNTTETKVVSSALQYLENGTNESYLRIGSTSKKGYISLANASSYKAHITPTTLTSTRTFTLPDASGTIALADNTMPSDFSKGFPICTAYNSTFSTSVSLTNNVLTQMTLNSSTTNNETYIVTNGTESDYGITVNAKGYYKVSASLYFTNMASGVYMVGTYIYKASNSGAYSSATEFVGSTLAKGSAASLNPVISPKLVSLDANDRLYLVGRSVGGTTTAHPGNPASYLTVELVELT